MYDDTVHYAGGGESTFPLARCRAAKLEPEVVMKLKRPLTGLEAADPAAVLDAAEWIAVGFEIIDCPFPDWQFKAVDFVGAWGLHTALVVGPSLAATPGNRAALAEALPRFTLRLLKDGTLVEEGSGGNSLGSPALCVAELAQAVAQQRARVPETRPLEAGELISTGSLTSAQRVAPGETWKVEVEGLPVSNLTLRFT
jgi:2-oxo-3-hexenedioate decarboxylase